MGWSESLLREFRVQPEGWLAGVQRVGETYTWYVRYDTPDYQGKEFVQKHPGFKTPTEAFQSLYQFLGKDTEEWWEDLV